MLRPALGRLDILLLEDGPALAVLDGGAALLPLDVVERVDALAAETALERQSCVVGRSVPGMDEAGPMCWLNRTSCARTPQRVGPVAPAAKPTK